MPALVTADLHLSSNPRDVYRFRAASTIADLIEQHGVTTLAILGDLTEEKDYHAGTLVNDVVDAIDGLARMTEETLILRGNHDYTDAECPFFMFLQRLRTVRWVNTPSLLSVKGLQQQCLFLPHTTDADRDWEQIFSLLDKTGWPKQAFAHNTFAGATSEYGKALKGIAPTIFPDSLSIVSGDVHTPQEFGNVAYVGSPYLVDFGDDFQPRVLLLYEDGRHKSLPVPGPQKRLLELQPGYTPDDWIELNAGDIVKVRYALPQRDRENWARIRATIREQITDVGCTPYSVHPVLTKQAVVPRERGEDTSVRSDEELVEDFAKQMRVSAGMVEAGLRFLR